MSLILLNDFGSAHNEILRGFVSKLELKGEGKIPESALVRGGFLAVDQKVFSKNVSNRIFPTALLFPFADSSVARDER
jgi:hypothetical protein